MFYPTTCVRLRYGPSCDMLSGFSREHGYLRCPLAPEGARYCRISASPVDLPAEDIPTCFNALFRQCAGVSLLRLHIALIPSNGMLTVSSIGCALRLCLRSRLTLIRLALIRNPWSCGEGVSRPLCRYLYLHLLFRFLQHGSRHTFSGRRNAPLPIAALSGIPRLRHRAYARLLSMRDHSTSELLRTL